MGASVDDDGWGAQRMSELSAEAESSFRGAVGDGEEKRRDVTQVSCPWSSAENASEYLPKLRQWPRDELSQPAERSMNRHGKPHLPSKFRAVMTKLLRLT